MCTSNANPGPGEGGPAASSPAGGAQAAAGRAPGTGNTGGLFDGGSEGGFFIDTTPSTIANMALGIGGKIIGGPVGIAAQVVSTAVSARKAAENKAAIGRSVSRAASKVRGAVFGERSSGELSATTGKKKLGQ